MKKILIVTDNLQDQINGVVTTYKNLAIQLLGLGYTVDYLDPSRFGYINCPGYKEVKLALPRHIAQEIEASSASYYHIATEGPVGLFARNYFTKRGIRYNTSYHTRFPEGINKLLGVPEWLTWRYIRWFHKHSGRCLTTTKTIKLELEQQGLNNVVAWTRGVDRSLFYPKPQKPRQQKTLLCVSRVSREKNLEAFCRLDIPNTTKVLVGDGPHLQTLKSQYPHVVYPGYKTGEELADYYQSADAFVFPSRWDTFGLVMLEAMACGTPVAAYPVPGPLDVVEEGVTGCLDRDLGVAVFSALKLSREGVYSGSLQWSWQNCAQIFVDNLVRPT